MSKTMSELIESQEFKDLEAKRRGVSVVLTILAAVISLGYFLLVSAYKSTVSIKVGEYTTLGIPVSIIAIVLLWALPAIYVAWANRSYDSQVKRLKEML